MTASGPADSMPVRWGREEDAILRVCVEEYTQLGQTVDWSRVAGRLPLRTNKDCRKRWINRVCGNLRKGPWEPEEDVALREAVTRHGPKWTLVAGDVESRSADQCSKRWKHNLDPRLDRQRWSPKEDELLLESVDRYGREWRKIQEKHYSTRSANDLKNRFSILSKGTSSKTPSRSELDCSSSPPSLVGDMSNPDMTLDLDAETAACLDSVVLPAEDWREIYNLDGSPSDLDQLVSSATNLQQPQNQQTRPSKQSIPLHSLNEIDDLMTDDNPEPPLATPGLFWPMGSMPSQIPSSGPASTHANISNTVPSSEPGLAAIPPDLYNSIPTPMSDSNGLDGSSGTTSNAAALQLGLDTLDPVLNDMQKQELCSLLAQRAVGLGKGSLGGNIAIQAEGCDREVLDYVLNVLFPIRHLVKMEINM